MTALTKEYLTEKKIDHEVDATTGRITVKGNLDLQGAEIDSLPDGLTVVGGLSLIGTKIKELPQGLSVGSNLYLNDKIDSKKLPADLKAGHIYNFAQEDITSTVKPAVVNDGAEPPASSDRSVYWNYTPEVPRFDVLRRASSASPAANPNTNLHHVQSILRLTGDYKNKIDGVSGNDTREAISAYVGRYPELKGKEKDINAIHEHMKDRLKNDEPFRKQIHEKVVEVVDANASHDDVKAAQVFFNRHSYGGRNDSRLVVDGLAPKVLRDGKPSHTHTALERLKSDMAIEAKAKATVDTSLNAKEQEKQELQEQIDATQADLGESHDEIERLTQENAQQAQKIEKLTEHTTGAQKIVAGVRKLVDERGFNEKSGVQLVSAVFNQQSGAFEQYQGKRGGLRFLEKQFEKATAFNETGKGDVYKPKEGDLIFIKQGGHKRVAVVESVDADGKLHTISPDGKGGTMHWSYPASVFTNPEIAKKAGIVGVGNTAELLERRAPKIDVAKAPDVKPEETPQAPAAEGTPPADSNANRVISPAVTSGP